MPKAEIKKNAGIIALPDDFARLEAVTKDGFYRYKINYIVDPIKAARKKTFKVEIHVATEPFIRKRQKSLVNNNPTSVIRQLRLRKSLQKDLLRSQRKRFILTTISDISKKIPNNLTTSLTKARFTNRPIISRRLRVKPALVRDLQNQNLELPVFDRNRNSLDESDTSFSSRSVKVAASNLVFGCKRDPAQLVGARTHNILSATRGIEGTISKKPISAQIDLAPSRVLVGSLINKNKLSNQLQLSDINYMNVLTKEDRSVVDVEETINIPIGDLEEDEFFFVLQVRDNRNITQQVVNKRIPHSRNISQLEIPTVAPEVTTLSAGPLGRTLIDVRQKDENATGVKIYRRELNKSQPTNDATYDFVGSLEVGTEDGVKRAEDIFASTNPIIYRVIPFNSSDILGADFGSILVEQRGNFIARQSKFFQRPHFVSINHEIQEGGINLNLKDFPPDPIALRLLRRDLTINEKSPTQVGNVTLINTDSNLPVVFEDTNIKSDRIFEYTVEYIFKDGSTDIAANNLVIEFCPVTSNILQLNISEPEVVQNGGDFDVQFTIEKDVIQTQGDLIKSFLQEQGLLGEYQDQIIQNRETLQELFGVRITRTNITTGEIEDFGIIQSTEFSDQRFGRVKAVKPLQPGFEYRYNVTAHARDPETLFPTLQRTVNVRTNVSFTLTPFKARHPITLTRGNLVSPSSLRRNHSKTTFTFGRVVDTQTVDVSLADIQPSLYDGKAARFGENSVLIQWKVQGNANKIDHFIVILEIHGMRTVVGKSHNITQNNAFQFVDQLTNKEQGELQYLIVPVFFDFSRGAELKTNQVLV